MQLRFTLLTVTSSQQDLHPQVCAHAGRTMKKATSLSTGGLGHVCECWHKASKSSEGVTDTD